MRLCEWRTAPDGKTFSYGGDEVELSVWDLEAAFAPKKQPPHHQPEDTKKRKRTNDLLPGELWRAKNARPDDSLSLPTRAHPPPLAVGRERRSEPAATRTQHEPQLPLYASTTRRRYAAWRRAQIRHARSA